MILKSDFLTHWKTRRLQQRLGSDAVLGLLRIWLHCEARRRWSFEGMGADELAAIAEWPGEADAFVSELVRLRWIDALEGGGFAAHDWCEHNRQLVTLWANRDFGRLGGRPRKAMVETPEEPPAGVSENPKGTQRVSERRKPIGYPTENPAQHSTAQERLLQPSATTAGELPLLSGESDPKPKAKVPRQPNPCFDALAELDGGLKLTKRAAAAVGTALAEIRAASPGVTPDEIQRRAGNLTMHFPGATVTASSLAKHWARADAAPRALNGHGRPVGELATVEAELRRMANPSMRELQDPAWNERKAALGRRRAELRGEAKR